MPKTISTQTQHLAASVRVKRAYERPEPADGCRILVDRVWPRGIAKADLRAALWAKEAAPSTALRKWFGHDPERWPEFRRRYRAELTANPGALASIREQVRRGTVTLLYSARDTEHNQARVLAEFLLE